MTFDQRAFRDTLGCFATGVCVAAATGPGGHDVGLTINSFTSVSLDPPLVLFCLDNRSESLAAFLLSGGFSLAILGAEQQAVSRNFASGPSEGRWNGMPAERWESGAPIVPGALAVMDCARHAVHEGGDHMIIVGRVLRFASRAGTPLLYYRGTYAALEAE
ncbi:flavin reductase family protein [Niveispirillum fermenti]|uniref:flavin reductase family protein n=1 Tax=Niveispirillum fermenti TaxID=1233113 RepID=UPI003A85D005